METHINMCVIMQYVCFADLIVQPFAVQGQKITLYHVLCNM